MLLEGKFARPLATNRNVHQSKLPPYLSAPVVMIEAPSGFLLTDSLTAVLEEQGYSLIWLRFGVEDSDPFVCLFSLARAMRSFAPQTGGETLSRLKPSMLAAQSWPSFYSALAHETVQSILAPVTLVLENLHYLAKSPSTLGLLTQHFLPILLKQWQAILVTQERLPASRPLVYIQERDLRLNSQEVASMLHQSCVSLSEKAVDRTTSLMQGRAAGVANLCCASQLLGEQLLQHRLESSLSLNELLKGLVGDCIATLDQHELAAMIILTGLEYNYPALNQAVTGSLSLPQRPWSQNLVENWVRLYSMWRVPVKTFLHSNRVFDPSVIVAAAEKLCHDDAVLNGISLLFEFGITQHATQYLENHLGNLIRSGFWQTVSRWMEQLPASALMERPWLIYAQGEMKIPAGDLDGAWQAFRYASEGFVKHGDAQGACLSLLALSTLATWLNDSGSAWANADAACQLARMAHLSGQQGWAEFQIACLSAREGNFRSAAQHFKDAADLASQSSDTLLRDCVQNIYNLVFDQELLQHQRMQQYHLYLQAAKTERQNAQSLSQALKTPVVVVKSLPAGANWLQVPFMLKQTGPPLSADKLVQNKTIPGLWSQLLERLHFNRSVPSSEKATNSLFLPAWPPVYPEAGLIENQMDQQSADCNQLFFNPSAEFHQPVWLEPTDQNGLPAKRIESVAGRSIYGGPTGRQCLSVCLLGNFQIEIDNVALVKPPGGRSGALFKYILVHHRRYLPREQLMEVFWPDVDPTIARNRLNVALSQIRMALRTVTDLEVVVFEDGKYGIDSTWDIWTDMEAFECSLEDARRYSANGSSQEAIKRLEVAANLYAGDFMVDYPYEEWTIPIRERLRLSYLDTLYQLSRHSFEQGQYAACVALCQNILERDNCREDVYCLLMRCYAGLGQYHLALRQYQTCVETLRQELDVQPANSTVALYERLRRHEPGKMDQPT